MINKEFLSSWKSLVTKLLNIDIYYKIETMKNNKNFTSWDHMKSNNYHWISLGFILASGWMLYDIESEVKWFSIFPFLIGAVVIPVANYLSWKGKSFK